MESLYLNDETNTIKDTKWILLLWLWLLNIFSKYPQEKKKKKGNKVYIYTVKPVYSGHLGENDKMTTIYR